MAYRNRWLSIPVRDWSVTTFCGRRGGSDDRSLGHSNRPANHLKCLTVNGAATVGMALEHARRDPAFQSERMGSTPVGSAKNISQLIDLINLSESGDFHWSRNPPLE